ncbi:uncharacterized protein LOC128576103 [Nycticebus coucang]|uniref:uncharacterized protein LOC128576103 n=1 Tax=Nycticebus coucang TaxID=9470 RepID=UPI00234D26C6|nr:uncharacterized protein LOC128576103 [Nycticebus coucang]XP_053434089.1 uncharacterized protein LOC128576103 [Nycticebus coucang]
MRQAGQSKKMAESRLSFEERKVILKWYLKFENIVEVRRQWRREYATDPPTRLTIARIRDKFETHGTVCDVHKGRSGRPRTATSPAVSALVLEQFTRSPHKSTKQCARETGISRTSIRRILKTAKWEVVVPRLLHSLNEDDPDRRVQYCEWFQNMVHVDEEFVGKMVWSDEAQFKLNGTVSRHNCVYWAPEMAHVEKDVHLLGLNVWCGLSLRGLIGPFFFEGPVTGPVYLDMLRTSILPAIRTLFGDDVFYFQQDGAPPHFHPDVRAYLDENLPGQWVGRRGVVEFPPRSPDLTPLDFYLWGTLQDAVCHRKPATLVELREEIERVCAAIEADTLVSVAQAVLLRNQKCLDVGGNHFEHLL